VQIISANYLQGIPQMQQNKATYGHGQLRRMPFDRVYSKDEKKQ
jgi:hypothetical protein